MMESIEAILSNSVFYPACGDDGLPVKYFNEHFAEYGVNSYVYVDYAMNADRLRDIQNGFRYYHIVEQTDLAEGDLVAPGTDYRKYASVLTDEEIVRQKEVVYGMYRSSIRPFARLIKYERNDDADKVRGPERFTMLYIGAEGVAAYATLYRTRGIAPRAIAIIAPGTGFGGNYTDFYDPDSALLKLVRQGESQPEYILFGYDKVMGFEEYVRTQRGTVYLDNQIDFSTMVSKEMIKKKKEAFAKNYSGDPEELAILAAVQHGYLYSPGITDDDKRKVKDAWKKQLRTIGEKYNKDRTPNEFISDIISLTSTMNSMFSEQFQNDHQTEYEPGFRIAHAQKSLSIYLKHCWCRGIITPIPPVCPIDGNVLKWIKVRSAWTKCNHIEDVNNERYSGYRSQLERVIEHVRNQNIECSVFEWELCKFKSDAEKKQEKANKPSGQNRTKNPERIDSSRDLSSLIGLAKDWYHEHDEIGKFDIIGVGKNKSDGTILLEVPLDGNQVLRLGYKTSYYFCGIYNPKTKTNLQECPELLEKRKSKGIIVGRYFKDKNKTKKSFELFKKLYDRYK